MRKQLRKFSRPVLVVLITIFAIVVTLLIASLFYKLTGETFRQVDLLLAIIAPLIIAPICTWWLFGLLIKLDHLEIKMRGLAFFDELTRQLTRRAFFESAELYFEIARRHKKPFALLMVDLDHFKKINDQYGHAFGDKVLRSFGVLINQKKRKSDIVGRYGGEEFIFILPDTNFDGVVQYTEKFHSKLRKMSLQYGDEKVPVTISIGVALYDGSDESCGMKNLIENADSALYEAKESGRDKTVFYKRG